MDGLNCNEIQYSELFPNNTIFRLDAEFFSRETITIDNKIKDMSCFYLKPQEVVSGPFGSSLKSESYLEHGDVPFVRIENIRGGFDINMDNIIYISNADNARIKNSQLSINDIVLSKVGNSIGFFARVDESIGLCNISENNIGIKLSAYSEEEKHYILTYLNSSYAQKLVLRRTSGNAQPKLNVGDLCYIPIPSFSDNFYKNISLLIVNSRKLNLKSKQIYYDAEKQLIVALNIDDLNNKHENINIKSLVESFGCSGRLDAEYYQPKYENFISVLNKFELTNIPNEFYTFKNSGTDYSEESCDVGVVKTKQLTKDGIRLDNIESYFTKETCNKNKSTFIKNKDVIFASMGVGSLGRASIFTYGGEELFVTDSTLKIYRSKEDSRILPEVLCVFLQSVIGQELIYRYVVGSTGIINIYDEDIAKIPIPILDTSIQEDIAEKVQESFRLRRKSKELLDIAIKAVEMAIETDEEAALVWLRDMISHLEV